MLSLTTVLTRRLLPHLSSGTPQHDGFRTWVEKGSFRVAAVAPDEFFLQDVSVAELVPYVSYDFERFALSSLESLLNRGPDTMGPKALGWPLARVYYAAFFGAHAIMRSVGQGALRLETSQAVRLSKIGSIFEPSFSVSSGTYDSLLIQNPNSTIDTRLRKLAEAGGAHDQFWRSFYSFLGSISAEVATKGEPEANSVIGEATEIQDILRSSGFNGGTWLSAMRNQFTYQHKHGAWFPFRESVREAVEYMGRLTIRDSGSIRRDHDPSKHPLLAFCACCHLIASVSYEVATALCERSATGRFKRLLSQLSGG